MLRDVSDLDPVWGAGGVQNVVSKHVAQIWAGEDEVCQAAFHVDEGCGSVGVVAPVGRFERLLDLWTKFRLEPGRAR